MGGNAYQFIFRFDYIIDLSTAYQTYVQAKRIYRPNNIHKVDFIKHINISQFFKLIHKMFQIFFLPNFFSLLTKKHNKLNINRIFRY